MGADGSRSPTNLQHLRATARWLSPFYGGLRGRFPCFAPISYHSPQKSSNIHAIYHQRTTRVPVILIPCALVGECCFLFFSFHLDYSDDEGALPACHRVKRKDRKLFCFCLDVFSAGLRSAAGVTKHEQRWHLIRARPLSLWP